MSRSPLTRAVNDFNAFVSIDPTGRVTRCEEVSAHGSGAPFARRGDVDSRDEKRGTLPVILATEETVTFIMKIGLGTAGACELVIRCDRDGAVLASLKRCPQP